ncbi:MAG: Holliday junction branch migration protein RuvA [Clostridiales bacterium]|nr:Holliday junction branch migration protein RuvA [Clostridiales bacterium]
MIAHIEGVVAEKTHESIVLDVQGMGFMVSVSGATLSEAPAVGERMKLYTVLNVREDAMELYGFYSREERRMYERLRAVTGVGSRTALTILSSMSVQDLSLALVTGDATALTRVPGIGKKTAQRLVLELRDKIDDTELTGGGAPAAHVDPRAGGIEAEAVAALTSLGFSGQEAARAVSSALGQTDDLQELIRLALKGRK